MELIDVPTINYDYDKQPIHFHHFTDIHMGAEGCDEKQLKKDVAKVIEGQEAGELHFWVLGGDNINAIGPRDRRHDATAVAPRFKRFIGEDLFTEQVLAVAEIFEPIRGSGLFVGEGNHEYTAKLAGEYSPAKDLARELNLPYAGYSAGFRLRFKNNVTGSMNTILGYWHHGFGAGRSKGAKANLGPKLQEIINVDITITGHVHEPIIMPDEELTMNRRGKLRLVANDKLCIIGSSYLKTYPTGLSPQTKGTFDVEKARRVQTDYGERKGYRPSVIGHVGFTVEIVRRHRDTKVKLRAADFR